MGTKFLGRFVFIFTALAVFSFVNFPVFADTIIQDGDISEDTVWNISGSPYIVKGSSLWIDDGATLTINPGVVVKFDEWTGMSVFGNLRILGTADNPVNFTSIKNDSVGGDSNGDGLNTFPNENDYWNFYFDDGSKIEFDNVVISFLGGQNYGYGIDFSADGMTYKDSAGRFIFEQSSVSIKNSETKNLFNDFILIFGGTADILDSKIDGLDGNGIMVFDNSNVHLDHVDISNLVGSYDSSFIMFGSNADIRNSVFKNGNDNYGIKSYGDSTFGTSNLNISSTSISSFNLAGLFVSNSNTTLDKVLINDNFEGMVFMDGGTFSATNSAIKNNSDFGFANYSDQIIYPRNIWWGDASGPYESVFNSTGIGDKIVGNATDFYPWLTEDPFGYKKPTCCSSVAFIPGIEASRLYRMENEKENLLWEPTWMSDIPKLALDKDGISKDKTIYTRDVIDNIYGFAGMVYGNFLNFMNGLVADKTIAEFEPLPYDWRLAPEDVVNNGVRHDDGNISYLEPVASSSLPFMIDEIRKLAENSQNGRVTIVTHSNGGLVVKALIKKLMDMKTAGEGNLVNSIDKVIMIAAPQIGTPQAVLGLLHGDGQELGKGLMLSKAEARDFSENLPSAYDLLPSSLYFSAVIDPVITIDPKANKAIDFSSYGAIIKTIDNFTNFILSNNDDRKDPTSSEILTPNILSPKLFAGAKSFHDEFDNFVFPENIKVTQIAGWGADTVKGIKYTLKKSCLIAYLGFDCFTSYLDHEPIFTMEGDDTVVYSSAVVSDYPKYYFDFDSFYQNEKVGLGHMDIVGANPINQFVKNLITDKKDLPNYITNTKPELSKTNSLLRLVVNSKVLLDTYTYTPNPVDPAKSTVKHTGTVKNPKGGDIPVVEKTIPGSSYSDIGGNIYVSVPNNNTYKIVIGSGGYVGPVTLTQETTSTIFATTTDSIDQPVEQMTISTSTTFADIQIASSTVAEIIVTPDATSTVLKLDSEGDGIFEKEILPSDPNPEVAIATTTDITIPHDSASVPQSFATGTSDVSVSSYYGGGHTESAVVPSPRSDIAVSDSETSVVASPLPNLPLTKGEEQGGGSLISTIPKKSRIQVPFVDFKSNTQHLTPSTSSQVASVADSNPIINPKTIFIISVILLFSSLIPFGKKLFKR